MTHLVEFHKASVVGQVVLELGSGRGRAALHLFLAGATVLGEGRSQVGAFWISSYMCFDGSLVG